MPKRIGSTGPWARARFSPSTLAAIAAHAAIACRHATLGRLLEAEQRQEPVAQNLVGLPAGCDHAAAHRIEELVDDEHRVVRQAALGQFARSPHVDEHDDDIALLAAAPGPRPWRPAMVVCAGSSGMKAMARVGRNWQARRTPGPAPTRSEHRLLGGAHLRQRRCVAQNADAAGRAASTASADVGVRNVVDQARLEHAQAASNADRAIGIGQCD